MRQGWVGFEVGFEGQTRTRVYAAAIDNCYEDYCIGKFERGACIHPGPLQGLIEYVRVTRLRKLKQR